jgi:hypothetical protein
MVFDPESAKHDNPPQQSDAAARHELEQALEPPPAFYSKTAKPQTTPVNVDGLAQGYANVGLDPAEARKVPKAT